MREGVTVYNNATKAIADYKTFFDDMKSRGYKAKVAQLDQVKLDFPDIDEDPHLKEVVEELRRKSGKKRVMNYEEENPEIIKRYKVN